MSHDDTNSGVAVKAPPSFPDASFRNVVLTLNVIRTTKDTASKITDRWLKTEHGINQDKQSARLIRFLQFVNTRKKFNADDLSKCEDWDDFRELLIARVHRGCEENGIPRDRAANFGLGSWDAFHDALLECDSLASRSDRSKDNIVACFRALADVCEMGKEAFDKEVAKILSPESDDSNGITNGGRTCQEWSFPIGRQEQGNVVYARVSISDDFQPGDFRRLAEILQMMDIPAPGSGKPG
jgi:hypothetical protein